MTNPIADRLKCRARTVRNVNTLYADRAATAVDIEAGADEIERLQKDNERLNDYIKGLPDEPDKQETDSLLTCRIVPGLTKGDELIVDAKELMKRLKFRVIGPGHPEFGLKPSSAPAAEKPSHNAVEGSRSAAGVDLPCVWRAGCQDTTRCQAEEKCLQIARKLTPAEKSSAHIPQCECLIIDKEPSAYHATKCPRFVAGKL